MKKLILISFLLVSAKLSAQTFTATLYASGFYNPICVTQAPGDDRLYVVEQDGAIRIVNTDGSLVAGDWLNIAPIVYDNNNEQGLLGLAFDPDYQTNGYFYVNYTVDTAGNTGIDGDTRISRFSRSTGNPLVADPASEVILLRIKQPYWNHDGGSLAFGPDGYLYCGMGDGGSGGDPGNRAQNGDTLLGKILRINVDAPTYTSPVSNPFYGQANHRNELWTMGNRNPWRANFDRITGDFWIGDVGQDTYEEIDHQLASSTGGENYGWRCYEGTHTYNTAGCGPIGNYTMPVAEIPQATGPMCSVTMGEVYRGAMLGQIYNKMIFSDYCNDYIWTLDYDTAGGGIYDTTRCNNMPGSNFIVTIFQDNRGYLYFSTLSNNSIYRLGLSTCTPGAVIETPLNRTVTCDGNPIQLNSAPGTGLDYQWLLNGSPIGGAIDSTYSTTVAGNYQLVVTNPSCGLNPSDTSAVLTLGASTTPIVSLTSTTADTACLSLTSLTLTGTPVGGDYLSPYVNDSGTFYVQVAGLGTYDVVYRYLGAGGCTGYDTLQVGVVDCSAGVEHSEFFGTVSLYPNPADDYTILSFTSNTDTQVSLNILSVDGKLVQQRIVQVIAGANTVNLNTSTLSSGIYVIQMNDGSHYFTKKVVIQ